MKNTIHPAVLVIPELAKAYYDEQIDQIKGLPGKLAFAPMKHPIMDAFEAGYRKAIKDANVRNRDDSNGDSPDSKRR